MSSFTVRLTLRFAVLVTLTTASVLALGGWLLNRQMIREFELLHTVEFEEVRGIFEKATALASEEILTEMAEEAASDAALYYFQVHDAESNVLFRSPNLGEAILPTRPDLMDHWTATLPGFGPMQISEFRTGNWHVQIASALAPSRRLLNDYVWVASLLVAAVGLISGVMGYGFSRFTLWPVRAIEQTAQRIKGDNLGARIPQPAGRDELADLTRLLNQMFDRLEGSFAQVKRFTAEASHELKTPLALLRLNAEKLRARVEHDREASDALDQMLEDMDSMRRMVESLLFLAKAESGTFALQTTEVDAATLIGSVAEDAKALVEDVGGRFETVRNDPGRVRCVPTLLRQLLLNLAQNAANAISTGAQVSLESRIDATHWRITIVDEGPGVPEERLERIFERFVHYPLQTKQSGHGLGLAICRSIVQLHGGTIQASNRCDRSGLSVVVELPRAIAKT